MLDFETLDYTDEKTWDLICSGKTVGVFQLESHLGREWTSRIKPRNIKELADVISVIRPGTLEVKEGNKTMTEIFQERKCGISPAIPIHHLLEPILSSTYQILVYQEQAMAIANKIAGFSLEETDMLRKGIGKKDASLLASIRDSFVKGCIVTSNLTEDEANHIFDIIEKSARYSFNLSHAAGYAKISYATAWEKVHNPLEFYCEWLSDCKHRVNGKFELRQLINDAKGFGYSIKGPNIAHIEEGFYIHDNTIYFGLSNIKDIGVATSRSFFELIKSLEKPIEQLSWFELMTTVLEKSEVAVGFGLISTGAIPGSRKKMLYEFKTWRSLNDRERTWIIGKKGSEPFENLEKALISLLNSKYSRRQTKVEELLFLLQNPPHRLEDSNDWIVKTEQEMLGFPISVDRIEQSRIPDTTCQQAREGKTGEMTIGVEIQRVKEHTIKDGKNIGNKMAFIGVTDGTELDCIAFTDTWQEDGHMLYEGNCVAMTIVQSNRGGFIIQKVYQL